MNQGVKLTVERQGGFVTEGTTVVIKGGQIEIEGTLVRMEEKAEVRIQGVVIRGEGRVVETEVGGWLEVVEWDVDMGDNGYLAWMQGGNWDQIARLIRNIFRGRRRMFEGFKYGHVEVSENKLDEKMTHGEFIRLRWEDQIRKRNLEATSTNSTTYSNWTYTRNYSSSNSALIIPSYNSSVIITNCTFTENYGVHSSILLSPSLSQITISNCTFTSNYGLYTSLFNLQNGAFLSLSSSTLISNFSPQAQFLRILSSHSTPTTISSSTITACSDCPSPPTSSTHSYMTEEFLELISSYNLTQKAYQIIAEEKALITIDSGAVVVVDQQFLYLTGESEVTVEGLIKVDVPKGNLVTVVDSTLQMGMQVQGSEIGTEVLIKVKNQGVIKIVSANVQDFEGKFLEAEGSTVSVLSSQFYNWAAENSMINTFYSDLVFTDTSFQLVSTTKYPIFEMLEGSFKGKNTNFTTIVGRLFEIDSATIQLNNSYVDGVQGDPSVEGLLIEGKDSQIEFYGNDISSVSVANSFIFLNNTITNNK
jgi:hypothetical protein